MKRRIFALFLLLVLLFTLAACGTEAPVAEAVNDAAQTPDDELLDDLPDETPEEDLPGGAPEESGAEEGAFVLEIPSGPKFEELSDISFAGPYLECLGEWREDVEETLGMTDETWDYLEVDGRPGPRPNLKEPVTIGGEDYALYLRFTEGPERDSPSYLSYYYFVRTVESDDPETKNAAIQALYDQLVAELGEPEEPGVHVVLSQSTDDSGEPEGEVTVNPTDDPLYVTVRDGFEQGVHGTQESEKWVLAENVLFPGLEREKEYLTEDTNIVLIATMSVNNYSLGVDLTVEFRLLDASLTDVARYSEEQIARRLSEN